MPMVVPIIQEDKETQKREELEELYRVLVHKGTVTIPV